MKFNSFSANIRKLYLIKTLRAFLFSVPILYPLFVETGLGSSELFIVQAAYAVAVVCFEIPTGFFGDKYSRKSSLAIGALILMVGFFMYFQAEGFWGFLIGEVLLALGASFQSGSDTAMLYDSLAQVNKEGSFKKVSGIYNSIARFAEAGGAVAAGFFAMYMLKLPFLMDLSATVIGFLIILTLREPPIERFDKKESSISQLKQVYQYIVHGHQYILRLSIVGAFLGCTSLIMVWLLQPYMQEVGLTLYQIGIGWALFNIFSGAFHLVAHKYEQRLGIKKTFLSLIWLRTAGILLAGFLVNAWGLLCFIIFAFVRSAQRTVTEDMLQIAVISKMRATLSSVQSMLFRLMFAIVGPIVGRLVDAYSLGTALYLFGAFSMILSLFAFAEFRKKYNKVPVT